MKSQTPNFQDVLKLSTFAINQIVELFEPTLLQFGCLMLVLQYHCALLYRYRNMYCYCCISEDLRYMFVLCSVILRNFMLPTHFVPEI